MRRRILTALASFVLAFLAVWAALCLINESLGANRASYSGTELGPRLWESDPELGYKNKGGVDFLDFGNVAIRTNSSGFRSSEESAASRPAGDIRIVGIGDSVMWGFHVAERETIMGFLRDIGRREGRRLEAINGAVIGYSSIQELFFFEKKVLPLKPDAVVLNFCNNDWAPTEDPFKNLIGITRAYLAGLLERRPGAFSAWETEVLRYGLADPHRLAHVRWAPDEVKRGLFKALIETPVLRMAALAKERRIRFVVLFIPYTPQSRMEDETEAALKASLAAHGVETLDLAAALVEPGVSYAPRELPPWLGAIRRAAFAGAASPFHPAVAAEKFHQLLFWNWVSRRRNFLDPFGHPTRKGNRIIAERLYAALFAAPPRPIGPAPAPARSRR